MTDHMVGLPWVSGGSSVHFHSGCTSCHLTPGVALVGRAFVLSLWLGESSLTRGGRISMEFPFAFPSSYWMLNIFFYALIGHLRLFWKLFVSLCSFIGWIIIWGRIILSSLCVWITSLLSNRWIAGEDFILFCELFFHPYSSILCITELLYLIQSYSLVFATSQATDVVFRRTLAVPVSWSGFP